MQWSFSKHGEWAPIYPVVLTNDERNECQAMLDSFARDGDQIAVMKQEHADSFRRSIIAFCLMGRAERTLILAGRGTLVRSDRGSVSPCLTLADCGPCDPEVAEKASEAAAKACGIFPLSIYFYDFACVLQNIGRAAEAAQMFSEFLRRADTEVLDVVMQVTLKQRNVAEAIQRAHEFLRK
jgi:hypothetical protein